MNRPPPSAGSDRSVRQPSRVIDEQPRRLDFRGHVGQLELNGLKLADGFAELFALLRVFHRRFASALRHAQPQRRNRNAPAVENLQAIDESFALFAQQIFAGHKAIAENHFGGVAGAHSELVFFFARAKSRVPFSTINAEIP